MRAMGLFVALLAVISCTPAAPTRQATAADVMSRMRNAINRAAAIQSEFDVRVTAGERKNVRDVRGSVVLQPRRGGLLRIDATRGALEGENAPSDHYILTSDGAIVTMRSDAKRTLFTAPMHRAGGIVLNARSLVPSRVFLDEWPVDHLEKNKGFRILGTAQLDGVTCDVLRSDLADEKKTVELAVGRTDHLPRRLTIRSHEGVVDSLFTKVKAVDHFDRATLAVEAPNGYAIKEYTLGGPAVGDAAPPWTLDAGGKQISLASLKGRAVIVDFWATWCGPCRQSIPELQKLYAENRDRGLEIVGATWREDGDPDKFARERGVTYPHAKGDSIAAAYGVENSGIPTMYVIDRSGRVSDYFIGWMGNDTARGLRNAVDVALR